MDNPEIISENTKTDDIKDKIIEDPNILNEIIDYSNKNLFIITKEFEEKIPFALSYIQNEKNEISNKLKIIKYFISLTKNVTYNTDLLLVPKSKNEKRKLNLYEILVDQYIYTDKKETDYIKSLEDLVNIIFAKLSYNKELYRYILSYISNFLNGKNNNNDSSEITNLNEYNYYQLLNLICLFYQSIKDDKPINYYFFNGDKNTNIIINNSNKSLDLNRDLYVFFFIKLIDYKFFENDKNINTNLNLVQINFKDQSNKININIDYKNSSVTSDYKEKLIEINIPYNLFNQKDTNNFLIKITTDNQIEIYIDGKDINVPKNTNVTKNIYIDNIIFSGEFYGIISSIMLYNDKDRNKMENLIPNYFLDKQAIKKDNVKFVFSNSYKDGFDEETLLTPFIKADIKDKVNIKNIYDQSLYINESKINYIEEIDKFIKYNLIALYSPTRLIIEKENGKKKCILADLQNNLNATFNINELYPNLSYSKYGGVRLLKNVLQDFSVDLNGINHLLPCMEIMVDYPELLTSDNLSKYMQTILNLFTNFKSMISNVENNNFFYLLSQFLEKIPEKRNDDLFAFIKSILITLQSFESESGENKLFQIYMQDFFNYVCMNEKILFKFKHEERDLILKNIYQFLFNEKQIHISINISNIINILLRLEKDKYKQFCCKKHAEYFNKESIIMEPELKKRIEQIFNIIKLIFDQYDLDMKKVINQKNPSERKNIIFNSQHKLIKLFEVLTFDITPCLQSEILNLYFGYFSKKKNDLYFEYLNINDSIILITLFVFKTSLFDTKEMAFDYLIEPINKKKNNRTWQEQISKYVTYYFYPQAKTNDKIKSCPQVIKVDEKLKYIYSEPNINKIKFIENYNKKNYYQIMKNLYDKSKDIFLNKKSPGYFNVLLSIASRCNTQFILQFLNFVKDEITKKDLNNINRYRSIINNQNLLQYLLDTCYQAYLFKYSKEQNIEFNPGFDMEDIKEDKEKDKVIDNILLISSSVLLEIFLSDVYKLDYLMTWSKYFYTLEDIENKYKSIRKFIFEFFLEKIIKKVTDNSDPKVSSKFSISYKKYLINIIFEYFAYHRTSGFEMLGKLKDFDSLYQQLAPSFTITLYMDIKEEKTKEKSKEELIYYLHDKWDQYDIIKSLFDNTEILEIEQNMKLKEEKKIFINNIIEKENRFNNDLKKYFIRTENKYFKNNKNIFDCNKGMELAIIKYHYYTMVLNVTTDAEQFKYILNNFGYFIIVIIIASTTVTIFNPKNANQKPGEEQWPNEIEYKDLQELVKIILFNAISFLKDKITEIDTKLETYKTKMEEQNIKSAYDNFNLMKKYLINIILIILKVLGQLYKHVKQKETSKRKSSALSGMFKKFKEFISPDKQGMHLSGGYLFINDFISNCLTEISAYQSNDETQIITTFLDDIPDYNLISIIELGYEQKKLCSDLENIYTNNISNNKRISDYFSDKKEQNQIKLFQFVHYIINRSILISSIIPTYDNSCNFKFEHNYLCLKPYYTPEGPNDFITVENIDNFSKELIQSIRMYQIDQNYKSNNKIRQYRKIKKKLFSFNGIFSTRKYFYDRKKYICKYRLLDHMTEDFTRIFLTPIIDMDYYLPKFSKFQVQKLFRSKAQDNLIQINKITNLCMQEKKENINETLEETSETNNLNALYFLRQSEYKHMDEFTKDIEGSLSHYLSYKKYIENTHRIETNYHFLIENCCYVKTSFHIRGFFYVNNREIGFYSYDKIPYKIFVKKSERKNKNEATINPVKCTKEEDKQINEIQKDYDVERKCCYGSIFSPQKDKYDYFHFSIPLDQIVFVLKRRYYYKVSCLEVFTTDKRTYFFKLDHNKLEKIIDKIKFNLNQKTEDILIEYKQFYKDIGFINYSSQINNMNKKIYKKGYMNLKNIYEKWRKWDISTMRLLMQINLYANRTYNDMNQYPVFPWVFTDYKSETFPIKYTEKIRPLGIPMGMLNISEETNERAKDYIRHWEISHDEENDDDGDDENNYDRYGSHYSTSLYVSYYLVRIFPFANIRIELQGTSFDDPNRLFNAVDTSFDCSSTQKSDLRELVPELYCFPEILLNNNDFDMGEIKDNNDPNDDKMKLVQEVVVPKWCNYNPYLFIKKQRELLECNEVSANINKWINLIFGSLQKGQEANKIHNLFAIQSYENYEKTYDELPVEEKDVSRRMLEFGITPNQVFKNDTSQRNVNVEKYIKNKLFYNTLVEYKKLKNDGKEIKTRLKLEEIKDEIKMAFNPNRIFYFPKDNNIDNINKSYSEIYVMNNENLFIYYRKPDKIINKKEGYEQMIVNDEGLGNDLYEEIAIKKLESKNKEKINLINLKHGFNNNSQPITWINNGTILVKGGYWNGNIVLQSLLKEKEKIPATKGSINNTKYIYTTNEYSPITKIVFDKYETFAICGNANGTIYIFRININNKLNWTIYKVINDHNSPIVSIALHENLNIAITCSENGLCMLYSLPYFKLYNSFILGKDDKDNINDEILCPDIVLISDTPLPCFIFYVNDKRTLYFYSINGKLLSKYALDYELNEKSIKIYKDYQFVEYLVLYNYEKKYFEIRSMVEFELIGCSPVLDEFEFIDFIFGLDMEHILVFGRINGKYKLYVIYDSDNKIIWK